MLPPHPSYAPSSVLHPVRAVLPLGGLRMLPQSPQSSSASSGAVAVGGPFSFHMGGMNGMGSCGMAAQGQGQQQLQLAHSLPNSMQAQMSLNALHINQAMMHSAMHNQVQAQQMQQQQQQQAHAQAAYVRI